MHLLRSAAIGTDVIDDTDHQIQGAITDVLFDPDRAKVLALFVAAPFAREPLVLQTQDIASWGNRIHIREADVLGPAQDVVRLQQFLHDRRTIIGQRIRTKSGSLIGKCADVQFRTDTFDVEWIFPRRLLRKGLALPASDILEITEDAIVVKDQTPRGEESVVTEEELPDVRLEAVPSPSAGRSSNR